LALFGLAEAASLAGGSIDPTDPANFNAFVLQNDIGRPARVQLCQSATCGAFYDGGLKVSVGGTVEEKVFWGEPEPQWFLVSDGQGHRVGCLAPFAPKKRADSQRVRLSSAQPCRRGA
jgi:hypothetical protein